MKKPELDFDLGDFDLGDFSLEEKPEYNPLENVEYVDNVEKDTNAEMSALLKAFKETKENIKKIKQQATDSEYWFCICFQSREQKDVFLKEKGWDEIGNKYLDGSKIARIEKIELPSVQGRFITERQTMKEIPKIRKGGDK